MFIKSVIQFYMHHSILFYAFKVFLTKTSYLFKYFDSYVGIFRQRKDHALILISKLSLISPSVQLGLHVVLPAEPSSSGNYPLLRSGVRRFGGYSQIYREASRLYGGRAAGAKL